MSKTVVRPYRTRYEHTACGSRMTLGEHEAWQFATDPLCVGSAWCASQAGLFPIGEFIWVDDGTVMGS